MYKSSFSLSAPTGFARKETQVPSLSEHRSKRNTASSFALSDSTYYNTRITLQSLCSASPHICLQTIAMDFKGPNLNKCANSCPSITYKNQEQMKGGITIIIIWKEFYALLSQDGVWDIVSCIEWWLLLLCISIGSLFKYLGGGLPHFFISLLCLIWICIRVVSVLSTWVHYPTITPLSWPLDLHVFMFMCTHENVIPSHSWFEEQTLVCCRSPHCVLLRWSHAKKAAVEPNKNVIIS